MDEDYAVDDYDEPFVGGVDSVTDDVNSQYETSYINTISTTSAFTPLQQDSNPKKRRGRPPKAESEKKPKSSPGWPSGAIRISLTPKSKGPRGRPPGKKNSQNAKTPQNIVGDNGSSVSPFPVVQQNSSPAKSPGRPRGRPRIHPPKDSSEKKPRGRPRKQPIIGEKAWQVECARLRRVIKKKDALIGHLKQRLSELGASLDDSPLDINDKSDDDKIENGADDNEEQIEEASEMVNAESEAEAPSHIEDTHQKYVEMFARDSCHSDDDEFSESA